MKILNKTQGEYLNCIDNVIKENNISDPRVTDCDQTNTACGQK
jgi:hypothetical protein